MRGRGRLSQQDSPSTLSLRLRVFKPFDSHARCTPWSVFQDGRLAKRVARETTMLPRGLRPHRPRDYRTTGYQRQRVLTPANSIPTEDISQQQWVLTPRRPSREQRRTEDSDGQPFHERAFTSLSLSFQSAFHLSLAVLVNYRSCQHI